MIRGGCGAVPCATPIALSSRHAKIDLRNWPIAISDTTTVRMVSVRLRGGKLS